MTRGRTARLVVRQVTAPFRRLAVIVRRAWRRPQAPPPVPDSFGSPRTPGLDCPQCKVRITVTIPMLLSAPSIRCHGCGLVLRVDREESKECLDRLAELQSAIDGAAVASRGYEQ